MRNLSFLSPTQAAYISKRARKAVRNGLLVHHHFLVLETLLWDARALGSDRVVASYSWLQKLAHVCRQTAVDAIQALVELGFLKKIKRKVLVLWANGGRQWQQRPNEYVFHCESTSQSEYPKEEVQIVSLGAVPVEIANAQAALANRRRQIEASLLDKVRRKSVRAP